MVRYCNQCGSELKEKAIFCSKCGAKSDLSLKTNEKNESGNKKVNDKVNGDSVSFEENTNNTETIGSKKDNLINNKNTSFGTSKLNLKVIIPIFAVLLIAVVGFTMLNGGKTVVLDGVEFNIPNGFKESNIGDHRVSIPNAYAKFYENEAGDFVAVSVSKDSGHSQQDITKAINSGKFTSKSINGYDGAFQITSGGYGCGFFYIKGDKIAMVYASDESLLSQLVK